VEQYGMLSSWAGCAMGSAAGWHMVCLNRQSSILAALPVVYRPLYL
jgi:hypothetical protein